MINTKRFAAHYVKEFLEKLHENEKQAIEFFEDLLRAISSKELGDFYASHTILSEYLIDIGVLTEERSDGFSKTLKITDKNTIYNFMTRCFLEIGLISNLDYMSINKLVESDQKCPNDNTEIKVKIGAKKDIHEWFARFLIKDYYVCKKCRVRLYFEIIDEKVVWKTSRNIDSSS